MQHKIDFNKQEIEALAGELLCLHPYKLPALPQFAMPL